MDKLEMQTKNLADEKFEKLKELFPNAITETIDKDGNLVRAIDKDILSQEISTELVEGREERYQFTWPDKRQAILASNAPTSNTLRPCREESVCFDETENLYIEGDNLEVLKILQETYLNKIDLVYVDPPYNTGTDMIYFNNFELPNEEFKLLNSEVDDEGNIIKNNSGADGRIHTNWLNMMYSRLKLIRNLLTDKGCFVLAIDHNELSNTIKMCDEIFGESNRLGIVTVVHKPEGRNQEKFFGTSNEFALFYAKNKSVAEFNKVAISENVRKQFTEHDSKGAYRLNNYRRDGGGDANLKVNKPNFWYPIYVSKDLKEIVLEYNEEFIEVFPITSTGIKRTWKTKKSTLKERIDKGLIVADKKNGSYQIYEKYYEQQVIKTHWTETKYHAIHNGTNIIKNLLGKAYFDFPKSVFLIKDILKLITKKNSLILDIFSGSATTAHATMQLNAEDGGNRKFIMVQLPEETDEKSEAYKAGYKNICEIGKERIRRAGKKIIEENKDKEGIEDLDIGFRVLKMDSSNMKEVYYIPDQIEQSFLDSLEDNIKEDRSAEDLLFQVMLDLGVPLSSKIEREIIEGKEIFVVEEGYLIACFDKDINDETVKVIAKKEPYYAIFRDSSMASDSVATNFEQIFESISLQTVRKVI